MIMIKHILIAGGAIAFCTAPVHAGGAPPSSGSGGLLQCLTCGGGGGGGSPIIAGNLNTNVKARVHAGANNGNLLNISSKGGVSGNAHANGNGNAKGSADLSAALKVSAKLPSVSLAGADCD
jgi:hypothetical protein